MKKHLTIEELTDILLNMDINDASEYVQRHTNYTIRVTSKEDYSFVVTRDYNTSRINVGLDGLDKISAVKDFG